MNLEVDLSLVLIIHLLGDRDIFGMVYKSVFKRFCAILRYLGGPFGMILAL